MTRDNHILTKNVCKGRDCSCLLPNTYRSIAHFTSFPSLLHLLLQGPWMWGLTTRSVCPNRSHSWRTKGTHHDSCNHESLKHVLSNVIHPPIYIATFFPPARPNHYPYRSPSRRNYTCWTPCQSPTYKERGGLCLLPWQPGPEGFQHSGLMIFNLENWENWRR